MDERARAAAFLGREYLFGNRTCPRQGMEATATKIPQLSVKKKAHTFLKSFDMLNL